jgi:hypothetical protein
MPPLVDPRRERFAQELSKPNRGTLAECFAAAGFSGGNSSRLARRPEIVARVRELQARAAELAELDAAWVLLKAKRLASFNVDDFLTPPNEHGIRYIDISKASRAMLETLAELTVEETTDGRGEEAVGIRRTKIKGHDPLAALTLIAKLIEAIKDGQAPVNVAVQVNVNDARQRVATRIEQIVERDQTREERYASSA